MPHFPVKRQFLLILVLALASLFGIAIILISPLAWEERSQLAIYGAIYSILVMWSLELHRSPLHVFRFIGIINLYSILAVYVKMCIYIYDPKFFFPSWIALNSPLALTRSDDWIRAFGTFVSLQFALIFGAKIADFLFIQNVQQKKRGPSIRKNVEKKFNLAPEFIDRITQKTLILGFGAVLFRIIVTHVLGIGHSIGEPQKIKGIPYVAGILQFASWWGGLLVITLAFTFAIKSKKSTLIFFSFGELAAFGFGSMLATGSKSELMRGIISALIAASFLQEKQKKFSQKLGTFLLILTIGGIIAIYPLLHRYRNVKGEMTFTEYLKEEQSKQDNLDLSEGPGQVLLRLNGLEGIVVSQSFLRHGGHYPEWSTRYGDFFTHKVMNVPNHIKMGIGLGIWGGMYIILGPLGAHIALFFLSWLATIFWPRPKQGPLDKEWSAALTGVSVLLILQIILFGGNIIFDLKQILMLSLSSIFLRKILLQGISYKIPANRKTFHWTFSNHMKP